MGQNLNGFYIGGEVSISGDTSKRNSTITLTSPNANADYTDTTKYNRGIVLGLAPRLGFVFGENMIYVKPGIEISRDKASSTASFKANRAFTHPVIGKTYASGDVIFDGTASGRKTNVVFTPAFGYERAMGKILFRAEYTYNAGKTIAIKDNTGDIRAEFAKVSYKDHRFAIGAAYKF